MLVVLHTRCRTLGEGRVRANQGGSVADRAGCKKGQTKEPSPIVRVVKKG